MSSVRQEVGQDFPTWSRGLWPDKSHLWSVSVGPLFFCSAVEVFLCFFSPLYVVFLLLSRQRPLRRGVEGDVDGGECGRQDLLIQG